MASVGMEMTTAWGAPSIGARLAGEPKVNPALLELDNLTMFRHVGSASAHTRDAMEQWLWTPRGLHRGQPPKTPVPETPFKGW